MNGEIMPTLQFKGKNTIWNHHMSVPYHTLQPLPELNSRSENPNRNLIVEGDNLIALKALLPQFENKVNCIYIDPPYNTGKEHWVYNDAANSPLIKEWLGKEVSQEDLTKHDKWLCMMTPRLKLLYELLAEDGAIVIHIDEHEISTLRSLLIEIFQEENEIGTIIWDKGNPKGDATTIAVEHEYIIAFAKNLEMFKSKNELKRPKKNAKKILEKAKKIFSKLGKIELPDDLRDVAKKYNLPQDCIETFKKVNTIETLNEQFSSWMKKQNFTNGEKAYRFIDDKGRVYRGVSMAWPNKKQAPAEYRIPLKHPKTGKTCPIPEKGWRNPPDTMKELLEKDLILFGEDDKKQPERKYLLEENMYENIPSLLFFGGSDDALFKKLDIEFDNPKPYQLAKEILSYFTEKDSIVLDSYGGSGTTAHAVMELNQEDGGNRQYVLIQMPENSKKNPEKNICKDITRERIVQTIDMFNYSEGFNYLSVGQSLDAETLLNGELPSYDTFAQYVYYLATGVHLSENTINEEINYVGTKNNRDIYLVYNDDISILQHLALNFNKAKTMRKYSGEKKITIYAPSCFLDDEYLQENKIDFVSIPYGLFSKYEEV